MQVSAIMPSGRLVSNLQCDCVGINVQGKNSSHNSQNLQGGVALGLQQVNPLQKWQEEKN